MEGRLRAGPGRGWRWLVTRMPCPVFSLSLVDLGFVMIPTCEVGISTAAIHRLVGDEMKCSLWGKWHLNERTDFLQNGAHWWVRFM